MRAKNLVLSLAVLFLAIVSLEVFSSEFGPAGQIEASEAIQQKSRQVQPSRPAQPARRMTRLFWQDRSDDSLKWSEVYSGEPWVLKPGIAVVGGFPKLDVEKQDLVQMEYSDGILLVGVRDQDGGKIQSGWIAIDSGVRAVSHGNHFDWKYQQNPMVKHSSLDAEQGNPAHVYLYEGTFFIANDSKNGFTWISPAELLKPAKSGVVPGRFFAGGGSHITMAAVGNAVCYATWIDGGGPNQGRVDVVNLKGSSSEPAYTFTLPSGVIHGATSNSGRVFFAPQDGVCWVEADMNVQKTADQVKVNHISLGTDEEESTDEEEKKPFRTGAFVNHRNWVLFTTGSAGNASLCLIDAKASVPQLVKVPIEVRDGLSLVTPEVVLAAGGKRYAFVFEDRSEGDLQEELNVIDLDPNGDRSFGDAKLVKTIEVGASKVDGHYGHHAISFDGDHKFGFISNPGDGTIWVLSLADLEVKGKLATGGTPGAVIAVGAAEHHH